MKNKYQRLDRKGRKQAIEDFMSHGDQYRIAIEKLRRIEYIGVFGFLFGIFSFYFDFKFEMSLPSYLMDAFVVVFCLVATLKAHDLIVRQVNEFLIESCVKHND